MATLLKSATSMLNPRPDMTCPCGSAKPFAACCSPLHDGSQTAQTAEALMRARYSAFVVGNEVFLRNSWHPSTRPERVLEDDARQTDWQGLTIIACDRGTEGETTGSVEFIARFRVHKQPGQLHEVSRFVCDNGQWFYVDGEAKKGTTVRHEKPGRNEPCPCGSGRKFKKCCGP